VGDQNFVARVGDYVFEARNVAHRYANQSSVPARALIFNKSRRPCESNSATGEPGTKEGLCSRTRCTVTAVIFPSAAM